MTTCLLHHRCKQAEPRCSYKSSFMISPTVIVMQRHPTESTPSPIMVLPTIRHISMQSLLSSPVGKTVPRLHRLLLVLAAHSDVRVVAVVEPDSLANLVTNLSDSNCQNAQTAYMTCTKYVLTKLQQCNIWLYLDAGHAGWLGWASNLQRQFLACCSIRLAP
jgi:hypothetical protein